MLSEKVFKITFLQVIRSIYMDEGKRLISYFSHSELLTIGTTVVWEDYRNGNSDIYMYNLTSSNETQITKNGSDQVGPAIYGDRIVWQDTRNGNWDIYMYNLSTSSETRITTNKSDQCNPAIYGDRIVWQDARNGNWDIYMYNLTTSTETQITKNVSDQCNPSIYGDLIVWQDSRNGNSDIYMYTISASNETRITVNESRQESPAIYDGRIVWNDGRNGNSDIYMCSALREEPEPKMPVANFSSNTTEGYTPLTVQFVDLSQNESSRNWDFENDGNTDSTAETPVYVYGVPGTYNVKLTATNENGTDSKLSTITVLERPLLPVASFNNNATSGYAPLSVQLNDTSTGAPTQWFWDFGDGANSTEQNTTHTYSAAGNYNVNLTVNNTNGTDSKSTTITVITQPTLQAALPVANFTCNLISGYAPLSVKFTDLSKNATGLYWDFGDGTNSTQHNPIHTYSIAGNYSVNLTVSNANGIDSELATINVLPVNTGGIEWGPSTKYDTGSSDSIAMDNAGHCVEVHVGSGRLFYKVGKVNFDTEEIQWGPSIQYDTGSSSSISMDNSGHCVEVHVGSGRLFYRVDK